MASDDATERYKKLGLGEALRRPYDYAPACTELSFILRGAYASLPKQLQSFVFQDSLAAIRLLPGDPSSSAMSAANLLIQAAEVALPKQKRTLSVSEFKHAVVAHKRRLKVQQNKEGGRQLPQDLVVHIFSLLDMRSLVAAGSVCRAWNSAASDDVLWQSQYLLLFGDYNTSLKSREHIIKAVQDNRSFVSLQNKDGSNQEVNLDWREAFKNKYTADSSWRSTSTRGYCGHCKSILWLSSICANLHHCSNVKRPLKVKPMSPHKVVEYLLEAVLTMSSSETDSDSDESSLDDLWQLPKLWAYPRDVGYRKQH